MIRIEPGPADTAPLFYSGEILEGRVIEQIDDHHALLRIKGVDLLVENLIPLSEDREGYFRVETTHPQVILKLIPERDQLDQRVGSWLKNYFSSDFSLEGFSEKLLNLWEMRIDALPPQIQDSLEHLWVLLDRLSFKSPFSSDSNRLQEILTQSGLFFEHKLKSLIETHTQEQCGQIIMDDMKGLLITLRAQLKALSHLEPRPGNPPPSSENIVSGLEQILQKIEGYQMLNLNASEPQEKIFLLLPLWFQNSLQFVEMNMDLPSPDPSQSESKGISILFLLQMPEWGRMVIEVNMKGKDLYCRFKVTDPEVSIFLSGAFPELKGRLNQIGFQPQLSISIETIEKMPQALLSELGGEEESFLNIVV